MDQFNSVISEYDAKTAEIVSAFKKAAAILKDHDPNTKINLQIVVGDEVMAVAKQAVQQGKEVVELRKRAQDIAQGLNGAEKDQAEKVLQDRTTSAKTTIEAGIKQVYTLLEPYKSVLGSSYEQIKDQVKQTFPNLNV
ncbi:hypothetical protein RvY_06465 [Ramazzottius varieornatus]|uniref:Uncharacterized protein n=1 Tax=Ramazzottius varieornatus TaxID=947166 RepID=A0A1D1V453_RAMVA|nr:hypothetical protein RvY_06465 [Ramazzottius varieornatus]